MMSYRPPTSAPGDRSHLERMVQALSVEQSVAADRLRRWVSTMVLLGALERAGEDGHRFLLKGGVAIELRLRLRARATKDVDLIVVCEQREELVEVLRDALEQPYLDFGFRVSNVRAIANTPAQRMDVKLTFKQKAWATVKLEASPPEAGAAEPELISAISLTELGLNGPDEVACQSLRYQIATKLHAVTERFKDRENDRVRDLIDLLLLAELKPDLASVHEACIDIFQSRNKQRWPPALNTEPSWPKQYQALARELNFAIENVDEAVRLVGELIDAINQAQTT